MKVNHTPAAGRIEDRQSTCLIPTGLCSGENDNWQNAPNAAAIQSSGLAPSDEPESAILMTLAAPATMPRPSAEFDRTTGIGLVEAYNLSEQ